MPRSRNRSRSIDARLKDANDFIENALGTPRILAAFEAAQRGQTYLEAARARREETLRLHNAYAKARGEAVRATAVKNETLKAANKRYTVHRRRARIAFKDDAGAEQDLDLHGPRAHRFADVIGQALQFYDNILADEERVEKMAELDVPVEDLTSARAAFAAADAADRQHTRELAEAKQAKEQRDNGLGHQDAWLVENRELARTMFPNDPDAHERLGLSG